MRSVSALSSGARTDEPPAVAQAPSAVEPAAVRRLSKVRPRRRDAAPWESHAVHLRMAEGGQVTGLGVNILAREDDRPNIRCCFY